jgi:glutathione S-transferase
VALYYEDQKTESIRRAEDFRKSRIPKFLTHFEAVLAKTGTGVLVGSKVSIADLTIFQVLEGLTFAFPKRMGTLRNSGSYEALFALRDGVGKHLEEYLNSERRKGFSNGIFRHYPELVSFTYRFGCVC